MSWIWRVTQGVVAGVITVLLALLPALSAPGAQAAVSAPASLAAALSGTPGTAVLDVVMLVDESGSETPAKVADEKQTAGTIVQTLLNPASRVTVIGFGGVNGVAPDQSPVDVACQPTIASGQANLDYLASCVGKLHRRTEAEGDDTDYAAALNEAMNYLSPSSTATPASPAGAIKVILMMTDGAVDVHRNTAQYGSDWQLGEQTAINQQLTAAKADGVQLWPLGFGTDIGTDLTEPQAQQYLNRMATSGAPAVCGNRKPAGQPHATWVNDPTDAVNALDELYEDAACLGGNTDSGPASKGLTVTIPAIASSAAISVDRVNPAITATFVMPNGTDWTDATAISGTGGNSPVEVLHLPDVTAAETGTWHIKLTAPASLQSQIVSATVFWQGAVRAIITATPSVRPGQPIAVRLTVLGPSGPITDTAALSGLQVGVTAAGQGLPSPVGIPMTALSGASEAGTYAGTYTAPSQPTTLTITGIASGYGLYATKFPATVAVGSASEGFLATPQFSGATTVGAGGTISGSVAFTNQTGSPKQVLLKLTAGGTQASISPATAVTVPAQASGNPPSVPFTVLIAPSAQAGVASLELQVVDASTGQVYNTALDEVQVTTPPPWYVKYRWLLIAIAVLLIALIVALLLARMVRRDRRNVRGLVVTLRRNGAQCGRDLLAPDAKYAEVFSFIIRDAATATPRLDYPPHGASSDLYQLRRAGRGLARLTTPLGLRPYDVELDGTAQPIEDGFELSVKDTRNPGGRRPGKASNAGPGTAGPAGGPAVPGGYQPTGGYPGSGAPAGGGYTPTPGYAPTGGYAPTAPGYAPNGGYPPAGGYAPASYPPPGAPTAPPPPPAPTTVQPQPGGTAWDQGDTDTMPATPPAGYQPPKNPWL